jgi:hypothetical protein
MIDNDEALAQEGLLRHWGKKYKKVQIQAPKTLEHDRPQHIRPVACVIAQQYSSAIFFPLRFHSRFEKFGPSLKNVISFFFFYLFETAYV